MARVVEADAAVAAGLAVTVAVLAALRVAQHARNIELHHAHRPAVITIGINSTMDSNAGRS